MKKLNLSIPTPCHENWEQMTQEEKGRFCGSCQKTVIDFTSMSDRQLAEFFKRPKNDVCGRFNNDQLEREIPIPKKRIPWIKYFFQFTWPAFMLGLKSCTNNTTGVVKGELEIKPPLGKKKISVTDNLAPSLETDNIQFATVGMILPEIVPYEKPVSKPELIKCDANETVGIVDTVFESATAIEDTIREGPLMEPVVIHTYPTQGKISVIMGGVSSRKSIAYHLEEDSEMGKSKDDPSKEKFLAYPNPVYAGSMLTITFPENNIPEKIQLLSVSGQLITSIEQDPSEFATIFNLRIPSQVSSGLYFLRLIGENKILKTIKVIVNK
jgi:hypothetical protein